MGFFTAVSGIRSNQSSLDVISNNIANANTTGFKSASVNFANLFSQTLLAGSKPNGSIGGVNPQQAGTGVKVSSIDTNFAAGGTQFTGRVTDLSIQGEGFFAIERADATTTGVSSDYYLSRAGNFSLDSAGNLVSSGGARVRGTAQLSGSSSTYLSTVKVPLSFQVSKITTTATGALVATQVGATGTAAGSFTAAGAGQTRTITDVTLVNFSIGADGALTASYSNGDRFTVRNDSATSGSTSLREIIHLPSEGGTFAGVTAGAADSGSLTQVAGAGLVFTDGSGAGSLRGMQLQLQSATVTNPNGLLFNGDSNFIASANSGTTNFGTPGGGGRGTFQSGSLESSNVDLAAEFSKLIIAQRGVEANSKTIRAQSEVIQAVINIV